MISLILLASYFKAASGFGCPTSTCMFWRNDGFCDSVCNSEICNFDSKADLSITTRPNAFLLSDCLTECLLICPRELFSNEVCDSQCAGEICGFDAGMCGYCSEGCTG